MIQTEIPCSRCGQPLMEIDFNRTHYMRLCLNWRCPIRRQSQGSREKSIGFGPITGFMPAPLPKTPSPPRGRLISGKKAREKTVRRKGLVYARKAI